MKSEESAGLATPAQAELDRGLAAWRQGPGAALRLWCGAGCGNCCSLAVNTTLPEALAIAGQLDASQRARLADAAQRLLAHARQVSTARDFLVGYRQAVGPCPFLDEEAKCGVYTHRPLACRALLSTRPADWCGVNLGQLAEYERAAFLASLDRSVVNYPTHYASFPQELAAGLEERILAGMVRSCGCAVSGSLMLLTWLCLDDEFLGMVKEGAEGLPAWLEERDLARPYLLQFVYS